MGANSGDKVQRDLESKLNKNIEELGLSARARNYLASDGIVTVRDLVSRTDEDVIEIRGFGETTLIEVRPKLAAHGLRLGMKFTE